MALHYTHEYQNTVSEIYFTGKSEGDMQKKEFRDSLLTSYSLSPTALILAQQIHADRIGEVSIQECGTVVPGVDALITRDTSIVLGIRTADCVPLVITDPKSGIIAAAHAGWKGAIRELPLTLVGHITSLGAQVGDLKIHIGPHIRRCCYLVSDERVSMFRKRFGTEAVRNVRNEHYLDLTYVVTTQLLSAGLRREQIIDCQICTSTNSDNYYSFRKTTSLTFGEQLALVYTHRLQ